MKRVGRTKTVLVYQTEGKDIAVVTDLIARVTTHGHERLSLRLPLVPDADTRRHIEQTVLPLVDAIVIAMGRTPQCFGLTGVNIGATTLHELNIEISGYSADLPVFLALLSAALQVDVPDNLVLTGHIASTDGDIAMVRAIPAKLEAAASHEAIVTFVCPAIDESMTSLAPTEADAIRRAICEAKARLAVHQVRDIASLLRTVFEDSDIALSSVRSGFIDIFHSKDTHAGPVEDAIRYLVGSGPERFWQSVESAAIAAEATQVQTLLSAFLRHYASRNTYPHGAGTRLLQIIASLPPAARRRLRSKRIVDEGLCLELGKLAGPPDIPDLRSFYDAASGDIYNRSTYEGNPPCTPANGPKDDSRALDVLLQELDERRISDRIGLPLSSARAQYTLRNVIAESNEEFIDTVSAYYLYLLRHHNALIGEVRPDHVGPDAFSILERAFEKHGGLAAARAEARDGVRGGLRFVIDRLTDQFIAEQKEKYVRMVLRETLDPLDWDLKVTVTRSLMDKLGLDLPVDDSARPAERYAAHCDTLVRTFAGSQEQLKSLLRTM